MKFTDREHFRSNILKPLIESGLIHPTMPDKLSSLKQNIIINQFSIERLTHPQVFFYAQNLITEADAHIPREVVLGYYG